MSNNPTNSASAKYGAEVDRTALIGELIVSEAARLAAVCKQSKDIEPLRRMIWILDSAMEQIGNQICVLKYCHNISDKEATTDRNGGQGDE